MPALTGLERIYQKELKKSLRSLNRQKWLLPFAWFYRGFYLLLLASAVFSIIIGLIPEAVFKGESSNEQMHTYMYIFVFLAILGICVERVQHAHKHKISALRNSKILPLLLALLFSIIIYAGAWYLGTTYVGGTLNSELLGRIGTLMGITLLLSIPYFSFKDFDEKFRNNYKALVIGKTQSLIELGLEYNTQDRIASSTFAKSKLYPTEDFAHYNTSDKFVGRTEKLRFEFCQVDTWDHRKVGKKTKIMPLFKGIFYRINVKEHFDGQTVWPPEEVRNARGDQMTEVLNSSLGRTDISFIKVDINDKLRVYSTDPDEAKKYITEEFIQKIEGAKKRYNSDISISLIDDNIYMALPMESDIFWPGNKANLDDYSQIEAYMAKVEELVKLNEIGDIIIATREGSVK